MNKDYGRQADSTRFMYFICGSLILFIVFLFVYEIWGPIPSEVKVLTPEIIHSILMIFSAAIGAMGQYLYSKSKNGNGNGVETSIGSIREEIDSIISKLEQEDKK